MDTQELTRILLIERDQESAGRVESLLAEGEARRFRVTSVPSAAEAISRCQESASYDVVVLDISERDSGLSDVLESFTSTPVVVMTDPEDEERAIEAVRGGALDYILNGRDHASQFRRVIRSAMERKRSDERARYLAHHDTVTGLPNRGLLRTLLDGALARARRNGTLVALLILDIDRFAWVNESLGHRLGDAMLSRYAKRLREGLRECDLVARMGGDEFAIVLEGINDVASAELVATKTIVATNEPFEIEGRTVYVTTSIGISIYPTLENDSIDALTSSAELAAYRAKFQGRNNYQVFTPDMYPECTDRVRIDAELRDAIANDEFVLHYQPQVDLRTGRVVSIESLIRWEHPQRGLLYPGDFIQVAEDSGLIVAIGECVLRRSCAQLAELHARGFADLRVSVNLSPLQFRQEELPAVVQQAAGDAGIRPDDLELELTESTLIENTERSARMLDAMKAMGMRIAVDDFGTGYSSLAYLQHFALDALKIDRSFVSGLGSDRGSFAISGAIVSLAKALNLMVVAEGVETDEQLQYLIDLDCDVAQGYLLSRPVAFDDLPDILGRSLLDGVTSQSRAG